MISIRNFLVFLSENKCLGAYWSNFEGSNFADDYRSAMLAIALIFDNSPRFWLLRSFNWEQTKEGYEYWSRLQALWYMRCDYLIKNED